MNNNISTATIPVSVIEIGAANFTYNPINRIYLTGRSSSAGMSLGANWNSYATVTYQP